MAGQGTKFFAGAAVAGGALWWYDQNVQPIFSKKEMPQATQDAADRVSDNVNSKLGKLESRSREASDNFSKYTSDKELKRTGESALDSLKSLKLSNLGTEKANDADRKIDEFTRDGKSGLNKVGAKYVDLVNSLGETVTGSRASVNGATEKNKKELQQQTGSWCDWFGSKKKDADKEVQSQWSAAKKDAEATKDSWFSWGSQKKEEADKKLESSWDRFKGLQPQEEERAKNARNGLLSRWEEGKNEVADKVESGKESWFSKKDEVKDATQDKKDSVLDTTSQTVEDAKKSLTSSYNEGRERAIANYEDAKKRLDDLTARANSGVKSLFNKPEEPVTDDKLKEAQSDFNSAFKNLASYGNDVVDSVNKKIRGN
ncbi:Piso0_001489 [Millerozyma farinosa CBS 7064]|uniref:Piso0_001489 protein n=1 Tax=Pichia sorbitophila (strain ATCC MYA-4447 / BCRC 22081 / CBS 7064 / NBRC 10061 / NRRL Y-12695) TaxID=559304 RepID=G8YNA9_PICSO|nr:Piso0_001489 [Millerozyma farinosa CBS 7064]